ncbi:hypothetical protein C0J52_10827 [Blattella germanica]|nr:hypothetical protein C0J52_10827 [Blattella germanica]
MWKKESYLLLRFFLSLASMQSVKRVFSLIPIFGSETCREEATKILRVIFRPVQINNEWQIRYNTKLYELHKESNIITVLRIGCLRWQDIKNELLNIIGRQRSRGRPRDRWEDDMKWDTQLTRKG